MKNYEAQDSITFIAEVFLSCLKADNLYVLGKLYIDTLEGYRHNAVSTSKKKSSSIVLENIDQKNIFDSNNQSNPTTNDAENNEVMVH